MERKQQKKIIDEIYEEVIRNYNENPEGFVKIHIDVVFLEQIVFNRCQGPKHAYTEINDYAKKIFPFVDLSELNLMNVSVPYTDFSNNNFQVNPQTVLDKNLRGCVFNGKDLGDLDFKGCDVRGASFIGCTGGRNFDKAKSFGDIVFEAKDKGNTR